jgi:hypothetical protein
VCLTNIFRKVLRTNRKILVELYGVQAEIEMGDSSNRRISVNNAISFSLQENTGLWPTIKAPSVKTAQASNSPLSKGLCHWQETHRHQQRLEVYVTSHVSR